MNMLNKHNEHLFLEKQDLNENSFIANVNKAVGNLDTIKKFNEYIESEDISSMIEAVIENISDNGNYWVVKLQEVANNLIASKSAFNFAALVTIPEDIASGAEIELPDLAQYIVGTHMLMVSYNGTTCYIGEQYEEIGEIGETSKRIRMLFDLRANDKIMFRVIALNSETVLGKLPIRAEGSIEYRTLEKRFSDIINVKDFGAIGNGIIDDSIAIQSAIIASVGKTLYFPAGIYICKDTSIESNYNSPLHIEDKICITGAGKNVTTIKFVTKEENTNRGQSLLSNGTGFEIHDYNIEISNISFEGDWGRDNKSVSDNWDEGPTLLNFFTTGTIYIHDCCFSWSRNMAVHTRYTDTSIVRDCEVYHTWADGICIHDAKQSIVVNNKIVGTNDDSIAVVRLSGNAPIENRAIITGNLVIDSCGIKADGVTSATITGNVVVRAQGHGIAAGMVYSADQVKNKKIGLSVIGNVIDTVFESSTFGVVTPGATRRLVYIYTDTSTPDDVAGNPVPYGNEFFNISNNICVRTLDPVAKYSDYGFGVRYARMGVFDGEVTDNFLTTPEDGTVLMAGIVCRRSSYGFNIENNNLGKMYIGALISGLGNSTKYLSTCNNVISGNNFVGFTKYGVGFISVRGDARVTGNLFDGDPNNTHLDRNSNGSWKTSDNNTAIYIPSSVVIESNQNSFKNVGSIYNGATDNIAEYGNTVFCDPEVLNVASENNIGIGRLLRSTVVSSSIIIYDADPTSPTYMSVKNICQRVASAMPTNGKYLEGMFVEKALKSVSDNSIIIGWLRKNTGDSNILSEDWVEVKAFI